MSDDIQELDLVCAIWIFACNDETSLITYRGIQHRLDLQDGYDVRGLVKRRPELFRPGASENHLEAWKAEMLQGRRLPSWIKSIQSEDDRRTAIASLTTNDVFRSQFRARKEAERSQIEIIKWGLDHIDRLRKARSEASDASAKRWQMWLVFWVSLAGVVSQFFIAYAKYRGWI